MMTFKTSLKILWIKHGSNKTQLILRVKQRWTKGLSRRLNRLICRIKCKQFKSRIKNGRRASEMSCLMSLITNMMTKCRNSRYSYMNLQHSKTRRPKIFLMRSFIRLSKNFRILVKIIKISMIQKLSSDLMNFRPHQRSQGRSSKILKDKS